MASVKEAIDIVRAIGGIVDVYEMDDEISSRIHDEELSVISATKMDVSNVSYEEVMGRQHRLCAIFEDKLYRNDADHVSIIMVNAAGDIVGTAVTDDMIETYKNDSKVIWLSSNFVIFNDRPFNGTEKFVIPACKFEYLKEKDGYLDAVSSSPAPTSDRLLKQHRGTQLRPGISTTVIGFNL
jgi:hypothetical protein